MFGGNSHITSGELGGMSKIMLNPPQTRAEIQALLSISVI